MKRQQQTRVERRESRIEIAKRYEPVKEFEQATTYCPLYLAWRIVDEARDYFRTELIPSPVPRRRDILSHPMGEELADKLARRAEAVFAHHPSWQRRFKSARGRKYILMSMRHWLAGVLARERPALFRDLPESFKVGVELPERAPHPGPLPRAERENHRPRFVHGCELLTV
jgi:hypothetical protein